MQNGELGSTGRQVGALGLGCMGMSWGYHESGRNDIESASVIQAALALGVSFFDTARIYGDGHNEKLIGHAIRGRRDVTIATKGGITVDNLEARTMHRDGAPATLRRQIDESLRNLRRDVLDLYYLHRVDPEVPLEESWGALAEAVKEGKVRWLGLSEVTVEQAQLAHEIHPVTAIQSELSLWTRDALGQSHSGGHADSAGGADAPAGNTVEWARANGASFIPFAPLGRGFLTNTLSSGDFEDGDFRKTNPRFSSEAFASNAAISNIIERTATAQNATAAQIALAWVIGLGQHIIPIPGTRRRDHLEENIAALHIQLSSAQKQSLDQLPTARGARY